MWTKIRLYRCSGFGWLRALYAAAQPKARVDSRSLNTARTSVRYQYQYLRPIGHREVSR
jgi:hypothetical protein